jgi:predicted XRE-type DNA-binding protein
MIGAQIIKIPNEEGLSTCQAEARTGVAHGEFSRIRRTNFGRFTTDRLMTIFAKLGPRVESRFAFSLAGRNKLFHLLLDP